MSRLAFLVVLMSLVVAPLAVACSGNPVVDATSGQGGVGGSGGSTSTSACEAVCNAAVTAGCPLPEQDQCVSQCLQELDYFGRCAPESLAILACRAQLPASQFCAGAGCQDERNALYACALPPGVCTQAPCTQDLDREDCPYTCGSNSYETVCTATPPSYACTCTLNGATVGTCTDTVSAIGECCFGIFAGP